MDPELLKRMVLASLMAALTAVASAIQVPIGPVPLVLTNLLVLLCGLLLGARWGSISMLVYLLVGVLGFPVFAGASGGIAHLIGPTGGYLVGFAVAAWATGRVSEINPSHLGVELLAVLAGSVAIYAVGLPWLKWTTRMSWTQAMLVGCWPFLPGDGGKAIIAIAMARSLRPVVNRSLQPMVS